MKQICIYIRHRLKNIHSAGRFRWRRPKQKGWSYLDGCRLFKVAEHHQKEPNKKKKIYDDNSEKRKEDKNRWH